MPSKIKIPFCIICGRIGVDLGKVSGKDVALCPDCAKALLPKLSGFVEALASPKTTRKVSVEELKTIIAEKVEKRGRLSIYDIARRYGHSRKVARQIAKALAEEKGWEIEQTPKILKLKKPTPRTESAK